MFHHDKTRSQPGLYAGSVQSFPVGVTKTVLLSGTIRVPRHICALVGRTNAREWRVKVLIEIVYRKTFVTIQYSTHYVICQ